MMMKKSEIEQLKVVVQTIMEINMSDLQNGYQRLN